MFCMQNLILRLSTYRRPPVASNNMPPAPDGDLPLHPRDAASIPLIVQLDPDTKAAVEELQDVPVTIREDLPYGCYAVTVDAPRLDALRELDVVATIDADVTAAISSDR